MMVHLVNAQSGLAQVQQEVMTLRAQLDERDAWKEVEADLDFMQDGAFWIRKSQREHGTFIPYCPVCVGADHKLIPLTPMAVGFYECAFHHTSYRTNAYREEEERRKKQALADESAFGIARPRGWMAR